MDNLIKSLVSRKLRKQGKDYNLSTNSSLSAQDFSYANKVTSRIHALSKTASGIAGEDTFRKLLSKVLKMQRSDEIHELGQLRIGYGNIQTLEDFQFNNRQSWSGFVPWLTEITCKSQDSVVQIRIPRDKNWLMKSYTPRIRRLVTRYHLLKIPFELQDEVASLSTKELIFTPHQDDSSKTANLSIEGWDNCLILVIGSIRSYLWDKSGQTEFLTNNRSYMAAAILAVFGVRDGQLIVDRADERAEASQSTPDDGVDWE